VDRSLDRPSASRLLTSKAEDEPQATANRRRPRAFDSPLANPRNSTIEPGPGVAVEEALSHAHGPGAATPVIDLGWGETARRLVGALEVAARHPRRWFGGLGYQFLALGWLIGIACAMTIAVRSSDTAAPQLTFGLGRFPSAFDMLTRNQWSFFGLVALALSLRLAPGLARSLFQGRGLEPAAPTYGTGRGLGLSTFALWVQVVLTMLAASLATVFTTLGVLTAIGVDPDGPVPKVAIGVMLVFLGVYGVTLAALYNLALASLARHDRGTGSALLHAWRLVRSQPAGASRAITLDTLLYAVFLYLDRALASVLGLGGLPTLLLLALSGLARAGFWSRTYHALGGVEPGPETGPAREAVSG
jgi:hypothetical protein